MDEQYLSCDTECKICGSLDFPPKATHEERLILNLLIKFFKDYKIRNSQKDFDPDNFYDELDYFLQDESYEFKKTILKNLSWIGKKEGFNVDPKMFRMLSGPRLFRALLGF